MGIKIKKLFNLILLFGILIFILPFVTGLYYYTSPKALFTYSINGTKVIFDASPSYDPDDAEEPTPGGIVEYIWEYFDNSEPPNLLKEGHEKIFSIVASGSGFYKIQLTVFDDENKFDWVAEELLILVKGGTLEIFDINDIKEHGDKIYASLMEAWSLHKLTFASVESLSTFVFLNGIAKAILLGSSITPTTLIAGLSSTALLAIYTWQSNTWKKTIDTFNKLADDPPDYNYEEIANIEPFETLPPQGETSMDTTMINLTNTMTETQAILKALIISIERYQGALLEDEDKYKALQARAIRNYSKMMERNLIKLNNSFDSLISEIKIIENNWSVLNDIYEMQERLDTEGFIEEEIQYFRDLGASDLEIEDYKQMLLDFDIFDFRYEIEELQEIFNEGITLYSSLQAYGIERINISLNKGWNLISIPLILENNLVDSVFAAINYSYLFSYNSGWEVPTEINNTLGYWIKVGNDAIITFEGTKPYNSEVNLNNGWNLIGYPSLNEEDVYAVLDSVSVVYAYNGSWFSYVPSRTLNSLERMKQGYGYWVKVE